MKVVVSRLENIVRKNPLGEKILVAPTYSAGRQLLESCTKQGLNTLNLRINTLLGLAEQVCQQALWKSKRSLVPVTVANELFIGILKRLAANGSLAYFGLLEITPGVSKVIYQAILDLKMAAMVVEELSPSMFINVAKGEDIATIWIEYEKELASRKYFDQADLFRLAAGESLPTSPRTYIAPSNLKLSSLERDFLMVLTKDNFEVIDFGRPKGITAPQNSLETEFAPADMEAESEFSRLLWFNDLANAPVSKDLAVEMFRSYGEYNELLEVLARIKKRAISFDQAAIYILMEFSLPAVNYYERARFKRSTLNFQDLLLKTRNMLRDNPEVRAYFHSKYPRLLVDEFQDTDPIQAEIIFYLTGQDVNERDWQHLVPYPGALFVVGDPKQSIYRFRRADIDTYNLVKKLSEQSGGDVLKLTANFRSVEVLGEVLNPIFKGVFPDYETSYQAEFSPLETLRPNGTETVVGVRIINIPADYKNKEDIFAADAEFIARYIRWALDGNISLAHPNDQPGAELARKPEPKDFMILLRFKDGMDTYARALEKYGIPLSITGGSSIGASVELAELYKVLRVLVNPNDQVLMVGVLRGLFFGFSDDELYQVKKCGGYFNIYSSVPEGIEDKLAAKYSNALSKLKEYLHWTRQMGPTVAIAKIITDLGIIPYTLGLSSSQSRTAYFYQALELLRQAEMNGKTRFDQIITEFGLILSGPLEDEISLTAKEENAVRLMNLHKAKGLEAPVVFLAQPYKAVSQRAVIHIKRQGTKPKGYFVFTRQRGFQSECLAQPVGWADCENEELKYLRAEESRLVYVAATRSKNMLVVSRSLQDKDLKKNPWALLLEEPSEDNQLSIPDIDVDAYRGAVSRTKVEQEEFVAAREQFAKWVAILAKPTYQIKSPTGLKEHGVDVQIKREAGGGRVWGLVIHKVFEELVNGNADLDSVIELALEEHGETLERTAEVIKVVESFRKSGLWRRIADAEAKYTEVPFSLQIGSNHPLYTQVNGESNLPIVLSGVIDLVFKETDGGWVIVDYKTDRVVRDDDLNTLTDFYAPQVKMYCQVWKEISKQECNIGEIYFVDKQQLKRLQDTVLEFR